MLAKLVGGPCDGHTLSLAETCRAYIVPIYSTVNPRYCDRTGHVILLEGKYLRDGVTEHEGREVACFRFVETPATGLVAIVKNAPNLLKAFGCPEAASQPTAFAPLGDAPDPEPISCPRCGRSEGVTRTPHLNFTRHAPTIFCLICGAWDVNADGSLARHGEPPAAPESWRDREPLL